MDRKWPDKVVITLADYNILLSRIKALEGNAVVMNDNRLKEIEKEIGKFNVSLGFAGIGERIQRPSVFQR